MRVIFNVFLLTVLILFEKLHESEAIQCVDHDNQPIDWFFLYKIPHIKKNKENKLINGGVAYVYITSTSTNTWKLSNYPITSFRSIVGQTLQPLYDGNITNTLYILYNDQPPGTNPNSNRGHTKGVVLGNKEGGLWLIHSVPRFPPPNPIYSYPQTGTIYGQSFLCISLNSKGLNEIGTQLLYNEPHIYAKNIPSDYLMTYPLLNDVINNVPIANPPWYNLKNITSIDGTVFTSFAKTRNFGKELYEDWVAPTLLSNLWVESWLLGPGKINSTCTRTFSVFNIKSINITSANVVFDSALDHSKWAITSNDQYNWICVGDINRENSQSKRGGGTVCLLNKLIATSYKSTVNSTQPC
nr:plancitoxin-1 [Onthophagus taurus]